MSRRNWTLVCWSDGNAHRRVLAFGLARGSEDFSLRGCAGFENACDACELVCSLLLFFVLFTRNAWDYWGLV